MESLARGFSKYNAALKKFEEESVIINWKGVGTSPSMEIIVALLPLNVITSVSLIEEAFVLCFWINL